MNNTLSQLAAIEAWMQGKEVECRFLNNHEFKKLPNFAEYKAGGYTHLPFALINDGLTHRLAPTPPKQVPWACSEDVPVELRWVRSSPDAPMHSIGSIGNAGITFSYGFEPSWKTLAKVYQWTDASRKVWNPCQKQEEQ